MHFCDTGNGWIGRIVDELQYWMCPAECSGPTDWGKRLQCTDGTLASTCVDIDFHVRDGVCSFPVAVLAGVCLGTGVDSVMEEMLDRETLLARLKPAGQEHLLQFWDEIDNAGRQRLASRIAAIDFGKIGQLYQEGAGNQDWAAMA